MNRVFTSNYDECKTGNRISISADRGRRVGFTGKALPQLAPKRAFWDIWHENIGKIPEDENTKFYIEEYYKQVLSKVDIEELLKDEKDPILLCFEKGQDFCHRHVVAEYIDIMYGRKVPDIIVDYNKAKNDIKDINNINDINNIIIRENKKPENVRRILEQVLRERYDAITDEKLKNRLIELEIVKELENEK